MSLRLGLTTAGADGPALIALVREAERLGFDSTWCGESYGVDAVTRLAWLGGQTTRIRLGSSILQVPARSPALTAMTAMTLDALTGGRFILGLGPSGPQVIEGWYGVPYGKPVTRTREYIQIMRKIMERDGPVEFDGQIYHMPNRGEGTTGLGKPLKSILERCPEVPIYTASITPAGLHCAGEVADGVFPVWMDPNKYHILGEHLEQGFAKAGNGKSLKNFDIAPFVMVAANDDLAAAFESLRPWLALYIGGMGAKGKNFYHDYATRLGYGEVATRIQDLYLSGKKVEAQALVPNELIDEVALVGSHGRIVERLAPWKAAGSRDEVGSMLLSVSSPAILELFAREML